MNILDTLEQRIADMSQLDHDTFAAINGEDFDAWMSEPYGSNDDLAYLRTRSTATRCA